MRFGLDLDGGGAWLLGSTPCLASSISLAFASR